MDIWDGENPNVVLIKEHLRSFQLEKWDNARIGRLCAALSITIEELCALCAVTRGRGQKFWDKGKWPPELLLHFAKIERFAGERIFQATSEPDPQDVQLSIILSRHD